MKVNHRVHIKQSKFASALAIVVLALVGTIASTSGAIASEEGEYQEAVYTLEKTANPPSGSSVTPGQLITYTLTARSSDGSIPGEGWAIDDDLSQVLNHASLVQPLAEGLSFNGVDHLQWYFNPSGEGPYEESISFQVRVNDNANGSVITNTAAAWYTNCHPREVKVRTSGLSAETASTCSTTHPVIAVEAPAANPAAPAAKPNRIPRSLPHTGA